MELEDGKRKEGTIIKRTREKQKKKERAIEVKELKSGERGYERERESKRETKGENEMY